VILGSLRGVPVLWVDGPPIREAKEVYSTGDEDARKFLFFSRAALQACEAIGWMPAVLHAQDWHAAPALAELEQRRGAGWSGVVSLLTIHNLPYHGESAEAEMRAYGFARPDDPSLPEWARARPLPVGLVLADAIVAVSPTYAQEIQTVEHGAGLESVLRARADRLFGIRNGIDPAVWNPGRDRHLVAPFTATTLVKRSRDRAALRRELGFRARGRRALLTMITRLNYQKGVDLALDALQAGLDEPWEFALLGSGDPALAKRAEAMAVEHAARFRFISEFNPPLARRLYAGADMILIPSRYEPCGLAQMIGMRYGCVPLVRATGGLRDTVTDVDSPGEGTGFVFEGSDAASLATALRRAMAWLPRRRRWRELQLRGMKTDFSWSGPAREYRRVYASLIGTAA
jgi:starch synthase